MALVSLAVAFVVTVVCSPLAAALARRMGRVAQPREDRWHRTPTPLLGGLAITAGIAAASLTVAPSPALAIVGAGAVAAFALGLFDDLRGTSPATKLVGQVLIGTTLFLGGIGVRVIEFTPAAYLLTVLWVVAIMNAINLLDNMDGLAAGVAGIAGAALLLGGGENAGPAAFVSAATTGAALGFLVHNFPPARIFMGDAGSQLLGYLLAAAALMQNIGSASGLSLVVAGPLLILAVPLFDIAFVTATRSLLGVPVHRGGRDHTSHRLAALGLSERTTVLTLYALTAALAALGLLTSIVSPLVLPLLILGVVGLVLFGVFLSQVGVRRPPAAGPRRLVLAEFGLYARFGLEVLMDVVLMTTAYYTAFAIRFEGNLYSDWSQPFILSLPIVVSIQLLSFVLTRLYRTLWRYLGAADLVAIVRSTTLGSVLAAVVLLVIVPIQGASRAVLIIDWILVTALVIGARVFLVWLFDWGARRERVADRRALIVGAAEQGQVAMRYLQQAEPMAYRPLGFVDDDKGKRYRRLAGLPILGNISELERLVRENRIEAVVIALADASKAAQVREVCERIGVECREFALA